jgi:hypothetical protein
LRPVIGIIMSSIGLETGSSRARLAQIPAWLWVGIGALALLLIRGNDLLNDPDMFWQIKVGQWILDHGAVPYTDIYSFTKAGAPWMSSSWLAQVLFAKAYAVGGWAGPVVLTSLVIAGMMALLVRLLERHLSPVHAGLVALVAFALCAQHFLARPHVLAMPIMVMWVATLVDASDRRVLPPFWLLPLMALWANLHGEFIFGLALVAPLMLDALWNAEASRRRGLALRWITFGLCALLASCVTPYGWRSIWAAKNILDLGPLLAQIQEWMPADFSHLTAFEGVLLALIGAALWRGVTFSPTRILLVLGFLHMALSHVRSVEVFALLTPIVLAAPLAKQLGWHPQERDDPPSASLASLFVAVPLAALVTATAVMSLHYAPKREITPAAAVAALKAHNATRVFNEYSFGGYLIWAGVAPFIDGRAELYGTAFGLDAARAQSLQRPDRFLSLLDAYHIDATLLPPNSPANLLLDRLEGWMRLYADTVAVVHVRAPTAAAAGSPSVKVKDAR